jgi:hypothetical protein
MGTDPNTLPGLEFLNFVFFSEQHIRPLRATWTDIGIRAEQPDLEDVASAATTPGAGRGKPVSGVYDSHNNMVAASARVRGKERPVDAEPDRESLLKAVHDGRDAYYLGRGENHYGHFILETLCRAWAWHQHGGDRVPVLQSPVPPFAQSLFGLIPGLRERLEVIRTPTRFRSMLVPGAAFVIARAAYVEFKRTCERMAEQTVTRHGPVTEQPLYLSRAGLEPPGRRSISRRTLEGELRLEQFLEEEGFRVVRPEALPIPEQVFLVNHHKWIVSPMGSACHTRLFSQITTNLITITPDHFSPNFVLCDLLCEGTSHYVNALTRPKIGADIRLIGYLEPVMLDGERLIAALRQIGLVRASAAFGRSSADLDNYKRRWIAAARWQATRRPHQHQKLSRAIEVVSASLDADE